MIAALYKKRWAVELFFKWLKQNLRIKHFYGTSENAVKTQIWIAVCVYALAAIIKKEMALDVSQTLAKHGLGALTIQVKVRYSDFTTLTRQLRVEEPVTSDRDIYRLACFLLARHRLVTAPLRLIGIGLSTLMDPHQKQLKLPI